MALTIKECQRRVHLLNCGAVSLSVASNYLARRPHLPRTAKLCNFDSLSYNVSLMSDRDSDCSYLSCRKPCFEAYRMSLCHLLIVTLETWLVFLLRRRRAISFHLLQIASDRSFASFSWRLSTMSERFTSCSLLKSRWPSLDAARTSAYHLLFVMFALSLRALVSKSLVNLFHLPTAFNEANFACWSRNFAIIRLMLRCCKLSIEHLPEAEAFYISRVHLTSVGLRF